MKPIYTAHRCEETGATIITPAEGADVRIQTETPPTYKFKKGDRVRNLEDSDWVKNGAVGTVNEDDDLPLVIWDSEDMLFKQSSHGGNIAARDQNFLELISEVRKPHQLEDGYSCDTTSEQYGEIVKLADGLAISVHSTSRTRGDRYVSICFDKKDGIVGSLSKEQCDVEGHERHWLPFPEFIARMKGEWNPISEAHSHLVVDMDGQSSLEGKWVKAIKDGFMARSQEQFCTAGKWYKIISENHDRYIIHTDLNDHHYWSKNQTAETFFDLSDPRDENPDEPKEVKIPFDLEKFKSGEYCRVETMDGREVTQLTWFDCNNSYPVCGVINKSRQQWKEDGTFYDECTRKSDLTLIVKQQ